MSFDLEAAIAEAEGSEGPQPDWPFTFDGHEYVLPGQMDIRAIAAISNGRLDDGLRLLLGTEQWDAIQASPKLFSSAMLEKLFEAYTAYTNGSDVGESSASTGSSKSTVRPSKPTSNASIKSTSGS